MEILYALSKATILHKRIANELYLNLMKKNGVENSQSKFNILWKKLASINCSIILSAY